VAPKDCEGGYTEINGRCFHTGDLSVVQKMIDNSYQSGIDFDCYDGDSYCGSPNPYMDDPDSWMWITVDGESFGWNADGDGIVEPLELGIQTWESGRLTSLMCGAYIYCQLSGPIPEEIVDLTELQELRLEYNYLSGYVPDTICELNTNYDDHLSFDILGNRLCPPYPSCINADGFWYQDTSACSESGDINEDGFINILDAVILISTILNQEPLDYQEFMTSDINLDGSINILDVIFIINIVLS